MGNETMCECGHARWQHFGPNDAEGPTGTCIAPYRTSKGKVNDASVCNCPRFTETTGPGDEAVPPPR